MEVASHGFVVISNGAPAAAATSASAAAPASTAAPSGWAGTFSSLAGSLQMLSNGISTATDQTDAVKWVIGQPDKTKRFGNIDIENIAAAGQSCGGILCEW